MIQLIRAANLKVTVDRSCSFVSRAVNQQPNASLNQSAGAHSARLDRRVNDRLRETVITDLLCRLTKCDNLGVRRRIAIGARAVTGDSDHLRAHYDDSADWHFIARLSVPRRAQRLAHPPLMRFYPRVCTVRQHLGSNSETETIGFAKMSVKQAFREAVEAGVSRQEHREMNEYARKLRLIRADSMLLSLKDPRALHLVPLVHNGD
jgi:hypothetical protein